MSGMTKRTEKKETIMTGKKHTTALFVAALLALPLLGGCDLRELSFNADNREHGLVVVFPGIDGRQLHNEELCRGLVDAGIDADVMLVDWTSLLGVLYNQTAVDDNRRKAAKAAELIATYRRDNPDSPVYLVGHSGGTAIAVWATELLPKDAPVEGVVLLASSLSPGYDLSRALAHTRKGIVNFYSRHDQALLNAGTTLFGTMDGVNTHAAGFSGFRGHDEAAAGGRLVQVRWNEHMRAVGYNGDHFSICNRLFGRKLLAPVLGLNRWTDAAVADAAPGRDVILAAR